MPSRLDIRLSGSVSALELSISDPDLIKRIWLDPFEEAISVADEPAVPLGTIRVGFPDGSSEEITLLRPLGLIQRGGRVLKANLGALSRYLKLAGEAANHEAQDPRPANFDALLWASQGMIESAVFSPDSRTLATTGDGSDILLWDCETHALRSVLKGHASAYILAFGPDGKTLALCRPEPPSNGREHVLEIVDSANDRDVQSVQLGARRCHDLAFSPDGKLLAGVFDGPKRVVLWDVDTCREHSNLSRPLSYVTHIAFLPNERAIVATTTREGITRWDFGAGTVSESASTPRGASLQSLAVSPDGRWVLTVDSIFDIQAWDSETLERRNHLDLDGTRHSTLLFLDGREPEVNHGGRQFLWSSTRQVKLVEFDSMRVLDERRLETGSFVVRQMKISPGGKWLAGVVRGREQEDLSSGGCVVLWDISNMKRPARANE